MAQKTQTITFGADASFKDITGALWRQRMVVLLTLVFALAIAAIISVVLPPLYETETEVLLEGRTPINPNGTGAAAGVENAFGGTTDYDVSTQITVMRSKDVIFEAYNRANIHADPRTITVKQLESLPKVEIQEVGSSNTVVCAVTSENKTWAQQVATFIPQVYEEYIRSQQTDTMSRALVFYDRRVKEEEDALAAMQDKNLKLRADKNLQSPAEESQKDISELNLLKQQQADSAAAVEGAQAALAAQQAARKNLPERKDFPSVVSNTEQIQREQAELATLERNRAELAGRYYPDSTFVKQVDSQIAVQKETIAKLQQTLNTVRTEENPEIPTYDKAVADAQATLDASKARQEKFNTLVTQKETEISSKINDMGEQEKNLMALDDLRVNLQHLKEGRDGVRLRQNQVSTPLSILSPPITPDMVRPNWALNLGVASILGLILGALLAISKDNLSEKVNSQEVIEAITGGQVLAQIPLRRKSSNPVLDEQQKAAAFESYRVLRTNLEYATDHASPMRLLVTSAQRGEGVSVVAANLARAYALSGKKVVYIDANFRHPSGAALFGVTDAGPGLGELLQSSDSPQGYLHATSADGLQMIPAGNVPGNIAESLGSARAKQVLDELSKSFEIVVVDAPSVTGLADTLSLAPFVGRVLFVSVPGVANRGELADAVEKLQRSGATLVGVAVNKVEQKRLYQPQL